MIRFLNALFKRKFQFDDAFFSILSSYAISLFDFQVSISEKGRMREKSCSTDLQDDLVTLIEVKDVPSVFLTPQRALHVDPDAVFTVRRLLYLGKDHRYVGGANPTRVSNLVGSIGVYHWPYLREDPRALGFVVQHGNVGRKI